MFLLDFSNAEDAAEVKKELINMFQKYGCVTVSDAYELTGYSTCTLKDIDRGWKNELDIVDARISTCDGVTFMLELPDPLVFSKQYKARDTYISGAIEATIHGNASLDQKAKADAGKPKLSLVPSQIIYDIAEVREYGNRKYGDPDNWKTVEKERYRDAAYRHFLAYLKDPDGVDEESGIKHYKHLCCNLAFLCEMEKEE